MSRSLWQWADINILANLTCVPRDLPPGVLEDIDAQNSALGEELFPA